MITLPNIGGHFLNSVKVELKTENRNKKRLIVAKQDINGAKSNPLQQGHSSDTRMTFTVNPLESDKIRVLCANDNPHMQINRADYSPSTPLEHGK